MVDAGQRSSIFRSFTRGAFAGLISLGFLFILRLGNIAPYPPESALEGFLKIIPESIQEPSVQNLGEFPEQLGINCCNDSSHRAFRYSGNSIREILCASDADAQALSF